MGIKLSLAAAAFGIGMTYFGANLAGNNFDGLVMEPALESIHQVQRDAQKERMRESKIEKFYIGSCLSGAGILVSLVSALSFCSHYRSSSRFMQVRPGLEDEGGAQRRSAALFLSARFGYKPYEPK